jgi:hypothetical protein
MTTLIFSNADYYKNKEFQKLMRKWNELNNYKDCNPEVYEEIVENLKSEFWHGANAWFHESNSYEADDWKHGIE